MSRISEEFDRYIFSLARARVVFSCLCTGGSGGVGSSDLPPRKFYGQESYFIGFLNFHLQAHTISPFTALGVWRQYLSLRTFRIFLGYLDLLSSSQIMGSCPFPSTFCLICLKSSLRSSYNKSFTASRGWEIVPQFKTV